MFRKNYLQGCCIAVFGFGVIVGRCLDSWLLCWIGGSTLLILGFCIMRRH